ncbi:MULTISPECIES: hypothetical protein [unclassified Oleiphilus]|uniref:hypothetical protein n=2 Tax=Oleiphilus TaxID=141450 RepID=UPI0007C231E7|nr:MULTISPECIES: hypothetical protein [unclassified Oleiphilus]KZY66531.1 hypothetical protein A3738_16655 [Oleiphilus sp. HI0066]KZY67652.1 hypothetical protein A3739_12220 [Oleiphilus sp. HI0067]KZY70701.1 hypothetical protein A3738_03880 [Oleiphilus sp. HI0066]
MGAQKVVFFHAAGRDSSSYGELNELEGSLHLTLPTDTASLSSNDDVVKGIAHHPHAILFDIVENVDYHALIDHLEQSFPENTPTMLGFIDDSLEQKPCNMLTTLPLDSYIGHNWEKKRVENKLQSFVKLKKHNQELQDQLKTSTDTALTAMRAASEIGLLMQLVEWLQESSSIDDVANALFRLCNSMELSTYTLILDNNERHYYPEGAVHEAAKKILDEAITTDIRVLSKNRILVFKLEYLVMVVTNAPWEDQEKYGRLRDILLQGSALAEAKARTIAVNNLINSQHDQVNSIMDLIKSVSAETQMYARDIMKNLSDELHIAAMTLDLTEEQEAKLLQLSSEAFDSMEVLYQNSDALELHFHSLISSITAVEALTKNVVTKSEPEPPSDDDVELF